MLLGFQPLSLPCLARNGWHSTFLWKGCFLTFLMLGWRAHARSALSPAVLKRLGSKQLTFSNANWRPMTLDGGQTKRCANCSEETSANKEIFSQRLLPPSGQRHRHFWVCWGHWSRHCYGPGEGGCSSCARNSINGFGSLSKSGSTGREAV